MRMPFALEFHEDSSCTVLGRITARNATGAATGVKGEGKWLKQADVSTITCKVFDLDSATPDTAVAEPTVTVSSSVLDTPVADEVSWKRDDTGYNFLHDLANTIFTAGGRRYRVEYKVTLTAGLGSTVFHGAGEGQTLSIRGS